tara:strand:- start:239 stop:619 length:381 start_codon:yes stop_codon:yes gene_type:complete
MPNEKVEIEEYKVKKNKSTYRKKSNEELKQLAIECYRGSVFTSYQIHQQDMNMLQSIFMPLAFMNPAQLKDTYKDKPHMYYSYEKDAFPGGINGYGCYGSVAYLNKEDGDRFRKYYNAIEEKLEKL